MEHLDGGVLLISSVVSDEQLAKLSNECELFKLADSLICNLLSSFGRRLSNWLNARLSCRISSIEIQGGSGKASNDKNTSLLLLDRHDEAVFA